MGELERIKNCLNREMHIIEALLANTQIQYRFIGEGKMKGLKRLLRESDGFIQELVAIHQELSRDGTWKKSLELTMIFQEINCKQKELVNLSKQALQQAIAEKARIAAELKGKKNHRQFNNKYFNSWAIMAKGRQINKIG